MASAAVEGPEPSESSQTEADFTTDAADESSEAESAKPHWRGRSHRHKHRGKRRRARLRAGTAGLGSEGQAALQHIAEGSQESGDESMGDSESGEGVELSMGGWKAPGLTRLDASQAAAADALQGQLQDSKPADTADPQQHTSRNVHAHKLVAQRKVSRRISKAAQQERSWWNPWFWQWRVLGVS